MQKSLGFQLINGTGYPQVNSGLKVGPDGPLHMDSYLVIDPYLNWIEFHELSHCNLRSNQYRGEREAVVNFPFTHVRNVHMNEDLDVAFSLSIPQSNGAFTTDNAAIDWMVTTEFRDGEEMNYSNTYLDQFKYQNRGSAKYANFVKLFGWQAFMNFNFAYNNDVENGLIASEFDTDSRTLRLSKAAGVDLTPLIHFWGIHPMDEEKLKSEMTANGLDLSCRVYDLISRYLTLIPRANSDFLAFFKTVYPDKYEPGTCKTKYSCGWYVVLRNTYNEEHSAKAIAAGEELLDNYYGNNCANPTGAPFAVPNTVPSPNPSGAPTDASKFATTVTRCVDLGKAWQNVQSPDECEEANTYFGRTLTTMLDHPMDNGPCGCTYHTFGTLDWWGVQGGARETNCDPNKQCIGFRGGDGDLGCYCRRVSQATEFPSFSPTKLTSAPTISPVKSVCVDDKTFKYKNKNFGKCAKFLKKKNKRITRCNLWDKKFGRLVKNHCPKTCNYCAERCQNDSEAKFTFGTKKYTCKTIPIKKCSKKFKKKLVSEICRAKCQFCV